MMHRYTDVLHKRFIVSVLVALNQSVGECALWCSSDEWNLLPLLVNNPSLLLFYFYFLGNCTCICLSIYLDCRILLNIASIKRLVTELEKKMSIFLRASITKQLGGVISWMCRFKWKHLTKKKKIQLLPRYSAVGLIKRRSPAWQSKLSWGQNILIHIDREALAWKLQQLLTQCDAR